MSRNEIAELEGHLVDMRKQIADLRDALRLPRAMAAEAIEEAAAAGRKADEAKRKVIDYESAIICLEAVVDQMGEKLAKMKGRP